MVWAAVALGTPVGAATVNWVSDTDGLWRDAYHWSTDPAIPEITDDAVIDRPGFDIEVTVNDARAVNSLVSQERIWIRGGKLTLASASQTNGFKLSENAGELSGAGNLTINGIGTWIETSDMTGSGTTIVAATGSLLIDTGGSTYRKQLNRALENFGTITYATTGGANNLTLNGGSITNRAGATFTINATTTVDIYGDSGTNQFLNQGTLIKTGTATANFNGAGAAAVSFVNAGTVSVQAGVLRLQSGASHTGTFSVNVGGGLTFEGSHTFAGTSSITGAGDIKFNGGGTSIANGTVDTSGILLVTNSSVTFNGSAHAGLLMADTGASLTFNGDALFNNATLTNISALSGTGQVTLGGMPAWTGGGTMAGSGTTIIASGATLTLNSTGAAKTLSRSLENRGTIQWNGSGASASLNFAGATLTNAAGATFNINGDGYSLNGNSGVNVFANAGTIAKSGTGSVSFAGSGTSIVTLNNAGALNVANGSVTFAAALVNSGTVTLSGGTMTLSAGLGNTGLVNVTGGVLNLDGSFTTAQLGNWKNSGGLVNLLGTLDNTSATTALDGNTGSLRMLAGSTFKGGTLATAGGSRLHVVGAATVDGVTTSGAVTLRADSNVTVLNGLTLGNGALSVESDVPVKLTFQGSQAIGGTGEVLATGSPAATLTLAGSTGSTLTIGANVMLRAVDHDLVVGSADSSVVSQGTIRSNVSGTTVTVTGINISNQGTFEATGGGTLYVNGTNVTNLSGGTLTGGVWRVAGNSSLRIQGADITTNATTLILDGAAANFYNSASGTNSALANLAQNAATGTLSILNGRSLATPGNFANSGVLNIGVGSAWTTSGTFTNSGTVTASGTISATSTVNEGLITQNAGAHTVSGDFTVGNAASGARYELNAGALNIGGFGTIGLGTASASFNMGSGTVTASKQFYVASGGANTSTLTMLDGSFTAPELYVGFFSGAQGTFNQSGGAMNLGGSATATTASLTLGFSSLATTRGTYNLSGGTLATTGVNVGYAAGNSAFNQTGGTHTISGNAGLKIALFSGGNGSYSLGPNGTLSVAYDEQVGSLGAGTFNQTGGTHNVTGAVILGGSAGSSGTFNLSGGTMTAGLVNLIRGSFNQTGGTLSTPSFNHSGGTVTGTLQNQGTYTYSAGTFPGRLLNSGTVVLNANITFGNGLDNRTSFNVATGRTVNANGAGVANAGTITVSGGSLSATSLANDGIFTQTAGASSVGNISGTGSVSVSAGTLAAGYVRQSALAIQDNALVTVAANAGTSVVNSLSISSGVGIAATLELTNNALVVNYDTLSPQSQIRGWLVSGLNGPTRWGGTGIRASAAAPAEYSVGYGEASAVLGLTGEQTGTFMGQPVDATSILMRVTRNGDATLDGKVDFDDLLILAQNYNMELGAVWNGADFTYDGKVDFDDLLILAQNYNMAYPGTVPASASAALASDVARAFASVPEPGALVVLPLAGALALLPRRRRRN